MNESQIKDLVLQNFNASEKEVSDFIVDVGLHHLNDLTGCDVLEEFDSWLFEKMKLS